jgi:polygalacturonase
MAQTVGALDVNVPVGGDIQKAVDEVSSAGGGLVLLAEGVHRIDTSIKMKSNVVLSGKGAGVTTITTAKVIKLMEQASEGLENITIQNLNITGVAVHGSHAIHLVSYRKDHRNVRLLCVHASQTGWGVHIKGADGVTIQDCAFTKNGAKGKEGYAHNLYLRRCKNALVSKTKLSGSTSGNGCNISYSKNVTVDRCEVRNNYFRGIRAADTDGYIVKNSIIGGNGKIGLLANREKTPTKNIHFVNNIVFNNGEGGIQARNGVTGTVAECTSFNNQQFDFDLNSDIRQNANSTTAVKVKTR